jgi:putative oxidoreductase
MIDRVQRLYDMLLHLSSSLESPFLLAVRLYWGWQFIRTGWGHLTHLDKVTAYFGELGIPFPGLNAPLSAPWNSWEGYSSRRGWLRG